MSASTPPTPPKTRVSIHKRGRASLGSGLVFVDTMTLHEAFAPMGLTYPAFLRWLRMLDVPIVHIDKMKVVRLNTLKAALLFISSLGQPDFLVPGCAPISKGREKIRTTRKLDHEEFKKVHKEIIAELLYTYAASGTELTAEVARLADETAQRMLQAALAQTANTAQARAARDSRRRMKKAVPLTPYEAMQALAPDPAPDVDPPQSPNDDSQPSN